MPTSQEDLEKEAARVEKLREQVANAEATRETRERELANDITMRQLQAEAAQLEARLAVAKEGGKVSAVKEGAAAPLEAVTEQMKAAVAQRDAAQSNKSDSARATESTADNTAGGDTASKGATGGTSTAKER